MLSLVGFKSKYYYFFFKKNFFSCLFGCDGSSLLHGLSLIAVMGGYLLVVLCRLLILVASLVAEHRL